MVAKTKKVVDEKEVIDDDISSNEIVVEESLTDEEKLDEQRLAELKARAAKKRGGEPPKIVEEKRRTLNIGCLGTGQGGTRLCAEWFHRGYPAVAINTAQQDLEYIDIPEANKLLLDNGLGGASRELEMGAQAAEMHREAINQLVRENLGDCQVIMLATSLGGGSGAGSLETLLDILSTLEVPVVVMAILPMSTDDSLAHSNALQTLAKLTKHIQTGVVQNVFVADNAKIETIYNDVNQMDFFKVSNKAIIDPLDVFNTLSSKPSDVKALDGMEWSKIFIDGSGLTSYGHMKVANYEEDTAIAEAVIENLNNNLLSSGFDLKQSKYVGVLITAPRSVWDKVPAGSINYAMAMINDICSTPKGVFKGIYTVPSDHDCVNVYSIFAGLGLPASRVEQLKKDAKELEEVNKQKDEARNLTLSLDTGVDETKSKADAIKDRIKSKRSALGKLAGKAIRDRRK